MIQAVTFDFWGTLFSDMPEILQARRDRRTVLTHSFFAGAGKILKMADVREALEAVEDALAQMRRRDHRCPDKGELGQLIARHLGLQLTEDAAELLSEAVSSAGRDYPPAPIEGAEAVLKQLHGKVKLGLISDTAMTLGVHLQQVMANCGLADYFDHCTWSDVTFTTKPESRQFLYTLHRLDTHPEQAVHVGDLEHADIVGAREAGMKTIRVGRSTDLSAADAQVEQISQILPVLRKWGVDV